MINKFIRVLVIFFLISVVYGCSRLGIELVEKGDFSSENRIILFSNKTEFKEKVTFRILEEFEKENNYIKLVDVSMLKNENLDEYKVIVILNPCKVGSINYSVRKLLKNINKKDNIILFTTTGYDDCRSAKPDIDMMTSASLLEDVDIVSDRLIEKIRKMLL